MALTLLRLCDDGAVVRDRTISSLFSARLVRAAVMRGLAPAPLWNVIGIEVDDEDMPPISEARHLALWEHVMRALDDPGFPIDYARTMSIDDYGLLGLACKTAATLRDALGIVQRFLIVYADLVRVHVDGNVLVVERDGAPTLGFRCSVESAMSEILTSMRQIVGVEVVPRKVTIAHRAPRTVRAHEAHFGTRPRFDAEHYAFELTAEDWKRATRGADKALHGYLASELRKLLAARGQRDSPWSTRTRVEAMRQLPRALEIQTIARALGTSARTLQRRLADEQTSFEAVVDGARLELAEALLADRSRNVADVALACGFVEPSSFSRAYRRWTGSAPSARRPKR